MGKLSFNLSVPQLPNQKMGIIIVSYFIGFLRGLNELIYVKSLKWCLARKSIKVLLFCSETIVLLLHMIYCDYKHNIKLCSFEEDTSCLVHPSILDF